MVSSPSAEPTKFLVPEVLYGLASREFVGHYARNLGIQRALVVSDAGVVEAGWTDQVRQCLRAEGIDNVLFANVTSNPRDFEVHEGCARYLNARCDGIIAVGGGSSIDCAKGLAILATNGGNIADYEGVDTIPEPCPPLICVPTTAGTSADVSQFCIITDTGRQVKMAIVSRAVVPDVSLVDPEVTVTMDGPLTASTGMDALTHAAEAIVSTGRSPLTDVHAAKAIELVWTNLADTLAAPDDLVLRSQMALASLHAGLAFSNASLGAVHAMAHALGGRLDKAHGECNAVLLPHVVDANFSAATAQYRVMAGFMGLPQAGLSDEECRDRLVARVRELLRRVGIAHSLADMGVTRNDLPALAETAVQDACMATNPRNLRQKEVESIYARAL